MIIVFMINIVYLRLYKVKKGDLKILRSLKINRKIFGRLYCKNDHTFLKEKATKENYGVFMSRLIYRAIFSISQIKILSYSM